MTRSEVIDTIFASALASRRIEIQDQVFESFVVLAWLTAAGRLGEEWDGGIHYEERLRYAKNQTFKMIGRGGTVSLDYTDFLTVSKWTLKTCAGTIVRFADDEDKIRGAAATGKYVEDALNTARDSLSDYLNNQIIAANTGADDWNGLGNIIATDPTTSTEIGGINQSTYSWWRNNYQDMSNYPMATYGIDYMRTMLNDCTHGGLSPDVIFTTQDLHEKYEKEVQDKIQSFMPLNNKIVKRMADLGFDAVFFKNRPIYYDDAMTSQTMYFVTSKTLRIVPMKGRWFSLTGWKEPTNQVGDRVAQLVAKGNLVCSARRNQGVLFDFS